MAGSLPRAYRNPPVRYRANEQWGTAINRLARITAALSAGLLATAPALHPPTAHAADDGAITTSINGVPSSLPVGGSFTVTFTVKSTSQYRIDVGSLFIGMWNMSQDGMAQSTGVTVLWNDPATGTWRASDRINSSGDWMLYEPARTVWIEPHGSLTVHAKVTLSAEAARGTFTLDTNGLSTYALYTTSGENISGHLTYNMPRVSFRYGSGTGAPATPTRTPSATPSRTSAAKPTTASKPSTAATTAHVPAPSQSPSAPPSTSEPAPAIAQTPATPTTPAMPSALATSSTLVPAPLKTIAASSNRTPQLTGLAVLLAVVGAGTAVLIRRSKTTNQRTRSNEATELSED
ncbi:hypothetical protein ACFV6F_29735 [Kitasatospora phosalacinea]|uniref:hypothetical protein n=1 Tax=Kitasatospora phosalacinea TaxID=2065 RepID=UPI00365D770F